jgi:riboflavin synthase
MRLVVEHSLGELSLGESVAVNGVCLTVVSFGPGEFHVDASSETLRVTTLGRAEPGARLNLERALEVGDRLGGHFVSGHVDGLAAVQSIVPSGDAVQVRFRAPTELLAFIAPKGSVTLDGVSLTVNAVVADEFDVMLIPHTRAVTNLGELAPGTHSNLEVDLLARYVARYLERFGEGSFTMGTGGPLAEDAQRRLTRQP